MEPGPDECAVKLVMDADCAVFFDAAEVALGQCLEPATISPGETLVTCGRIQAGAKLLWSVRSPTFVPSELGLVDFICPGATSPDVPCDWAWSWEDTCPKGGLTIPYEISCQYSPNDPG